MSVPAVFEAWQYYITRIKHVCVSDVLWSSQALLADMLMTATQGHYEDRLVHAS